MKKQTKIKCILLVAVVLLLITSFNSSKEKKENVSNSKPNLVLFMADDCSYYDLASYGSVDSQTPHIDKFATEGIKFTKAYQAVPMCSPTRHKLYTGLWPIKSGVYPNHTMANNGTLSIIHHLKSAGYKVALVGKSHVKPESVFPWDLYSPLSKTNELNFADIDSFIKTCTKNNQPFCHFVMYNQPHAPWDKGNSNMFNPEKIKLRPFFVDTKNTREEFCNYLAEVNYMDNEFGQVLDKIDQYKIKDKTVVVYLSEQGNSNGFDYFYGHYNGAIDYFTHKRAGEIDWHRNNEPCFDEGYSTDLVEKEVVNFLNTSKKDEPFFAYVAFNAPHSPMQAKEEELKEYGYDPTVENEDYVIVGSQPGESDLENYGKIGRGNNLRQTFSGMVSSLDKSIGNILKVLKENKLDENTIVWFLSDNGGSYIFGGNNKPLRGAKHEEWEGGVRVVSILRWLGKIEPNTKMTKLVAYIDVLPTILNIIGDKPTESFDGINVMGAINGWRTTR